MWKIIIHRLVLTEDLKKIDPSTCRLIFKLIYKKLAKDPESYGSPLSGEYKGYWKLRAGHFRVLYEIIKDEVVVKVIKVGIRRNDKVYMDFIHRLKAISRDRRA